MSSSATNEELKSQFLTILRQVTGAHETPAPAGEPWSHATTFAGRPLRFSMTGYRRFSDAEVGASLGGRPIALQFATRHQNVSGLPPVATGDPSFDTVHKAHGVPEEVVAALLEPAVRRWLIETYGGEAPGIDTSGDYVRLRIRVGHRNGAVQLPGGEVPGPQAIAQWLQALLMVTDALCRGFDAHHARLQAAQGPAAAQSWVDRAAAFKSRGVMVSEPRVLLLVLAILALGVLIVGAAIAALHFAF